MSVSLPTFERLKTRGLAAYKADNCAEAIPFLMQAADAPCTTVTAWYGNKWATEANS